MDITSVIDEKKIEETVVETKEIEETILEITEDETVLETKDSTEEIEESGEEKTKERTFFDKKVTIKPLDIVNYWIDCENDQGIFNAKKNFLKFALKNLENEKYAMVHQTYDIIKYLSEVSRMHFRVIARHTDSKTKKIATLYEWRLNRKIFFILGIDDDETEISWYKDRVSFYKDLMDKSHKSRDSDEIDSKTYSILRRNSLHDFSGKFISTMFFDSFEMARAAMIMKVNGHVTFMKKET